MSAEQRMLNALRAKRDTAQVRAEQCVAACAGMDDPAEEIEHLRDIEAKHADAVADLMQADEQRDELLAGAKVLLEQYDASGDFTMGGKLTNQPFLMLRAAIERSRP